jgi:hypothetical protein
LFTRERQLCDLEGRFGFVDRVLKRPFVELQQDCPIFNRLIGFGRNIGLPGPMARVSAGRR